MPHIDGAVVLDNLEHISGCDLMLSTEQFPATTEDLIKMHLDKGALLVQRKHGLDLSQSVGERMNSSLSKMRQLGAKSSQCVLLFIGIMTNNSEGKATINRQDTHMSFWALQSAISRWHDRGGVFESLPKSSLIEDWCNMKLRHIEEYKKQPDKEFFPSNPAVHREDEILQVLIPVVDPRITLCTFPGIGEKTATLLMDEFGTLSDAVAWLTFPDTKGSTKVKGIGKVTKQKAREWLGLPEAMVMHLEVNKTLQMQLEKVEK
jgi:hypothetical protein